MLYSPSRLTYELLLLYHIDKYVDFFIQLFKPISDRVCIKGPLVGNLKNEIIKF